MFSRCIHVESDDDYYNSPKMDVQVVCDKSYTILSTENTVETQEQSSHDCSDELDLQPEPANIIEISEASEPIDPTSVEQMTETYQNKFREPTDRLYKCDECSASFSRQTLLAAHKKKHKEGPPYSCDDCNQSFENEDDWLDHREVGCIANTRYLHSKSRNIRTHDTRWNKIYKYGGESEEKRFKCRHCSKSFKSIGTRNDHERNLHKGLRPHSCDECGKQFYRKFNLAVHKRKHSSERPHECKICHKRFKSSISVKIHMEIHSDKRPFMCENCGKVFKTLSVLESHRTIHTGETKYNCSVCGKSYRYRASLFIHMRTHTGQRPYSCSHCSASFMVKSHLTEHLRIHTGERPFECEFCFACFSRSISLKKHLKSHIRAGFDVNLESAMYHAKLQARITPRDNCISTSDEQQLIPKVTHYIKDHMFVNVKNCKSLKEPFTESLMLYTNPQTDGEALVVFTITSIGDGSTCTHHLNNVPTENTTPRFASNKKNVVETSDIIQDQELVFLDNLQGNGTIRLTDLTQVCNSQQNEETVPVISLPDYDISSGNVTADSVVLNQLSNYDCYTDKTSIETGLCRDWMISRNVITDTVLKSAHASSIAASSVGQQRDSQTYSMKSEKQKSIVSISSNVDVECEKTDGASLHQISVKNEEEILMDNKIKSILLNQDISVGSDINTNYMDKQSDTSLILAQLEESEPAPSFDRKTKVRSSKYRRKPLRKCRYCDVSYRYVALLEAHEAKHELNGKEFVTAKNENESNEKLHCQFLSASAACIEDLPYKCEKCNSSFSFRSEFRNHVKLHSNKYHYTCKKCHQAFQHEIFLAKHQCGRSYVSFPHFTHNSQLTQSNPKGAEKNSESETKYKCDKCGKTYLKEFILKVHYRKHTGKRPFKCRDCNKRFISATHHKVHKRIHTGERPYTCEACNKSFRRRSKLHHHINVCKGVVESGSCRDNAGSEITDNVKLCKTLSDSEIAVTIKSENLSHPSPAVKEEPWEEYIKVEPHEIEGKSCIKNEDQTNILVTRVVKSETNLSEIKENDLDVSKLISKDDSYLPANKVVSEELQTFVSSNTVRKKRIKAPQGLHRCTHCPKFFEFRSTLHAHERSHTGEKPFCCSECGKAFSKKSNMVMHMRIHTGERPFLCDYCGKYFTYKYTLNAHKRLHTQERPFTCGVCGKRFRYEASRHVHLKRHAGDRAFKCDLCPKAFVAKVDMEDHRRTHTGEKPYKCEHCERKFTVRHHLTEHRRLHTGEKPFKCQFCTMTFARTGTRKMHVQRHLKMSGGQYL